MNETLKKLGLMGIVPVVKINDADDAGDLADALCDGGLPCAEVTFRTDAAADAIKEMKKRRPEMLIGAGTVLTPEQADRAVKAGAEFIVSPGLNTDVVGHCIKKGYPVMPGIATPSEAETAIALGLDAVKFFPAEAAGGLKMVKAMSAPYSGLMFMPTGGINPDNMNTWLSFKKILCCGGSWMVPADLIASHSFDEIKRMTAEAVKKMLGFKLAHIGVNCADEASAESTAASFASVLGYDGDERTKSVFVGHVEIMKSIGKGKNGHIAISALSVDRAAAYLERKGIELDYESAKYDADGKLTFIYIKGEVGGFAIHLVSEK